MYYSPIVYKLGRYYTGQHTARSTARPLPLTHQLHRGPIGVNRHPTATKELRTSACDSLAGQSASVRLGATRASESSLGELPFDCTGKRQLPVVGSRPAGESGPGTSALPRHRDSTLIKGRLGEPPTRTTRSWTRRPQASSCRSLEDQLAQTRRHVPVTTKQLEPATRRRPG